MRNGLTDDTFVDQIKRAPIAKTVLFWRNFDRVSPTYWIFILGLIAAFISWIVLGHSPAFWVSSGLVLFIVVPVVVFVALSLK